MSRCRAAWIVCLVSLLAASPCLAQPVFLVDASTLGTTDLKNADNPDDGYVTRNLPTVGTFNFYGVTRTTVDVGINGNLNFNVDESFTNLPLPTGIGVNRMAALWDDFSLVGAGANTDILDNQGDSVRPYYVAMWKEVPIYQSSATHTFQVIWFGASLNLSGFDFLAGDIVFDYANLGNEFREELGGEGATVGLDLGNNSNFTPLPGTTNGVISDTTLLPKDSNNFLLFRYNENTNNYSVSIQSVPEPTTWALLIGTAALAGYAYTRRQQKACQAAVQPIEVTQE